MLTLYVLLTLALIQIKHLIIDWIWQPPYEFSNKGTYGHWGGVRHAMKNALGTGLCVFVGFGGWASPLLCALIAALDFVIHYHIDWAKMNLNARCHLEPCSPRFWWLLGTDQFAHQMTYLGLICYVLVNVPTV